MDNVKYNFKFRERFLADELTPTERQAFEEELEKDPSLKELLDNQILLGDWIGEALDAEEEQEKGPRIIHMLRGAMKKYPTAMAAAFAILLIGAWLLIDRPWQGPSLGEQVFAANKQIYVNPELRGATRGSSAYEDPKSQDMDPELLQILKNTYAAGVELYPDAINQLNVYIKDNKDKSGKALFYRGMSFYGIDKTGKASKDLTQYLKLGEGTKYEEAAQYYLALCLLNEEKVELAKSYFKGIVLEGGVYAGRSDDILDELEEHTKSKKK